MFHAMWAWDGGEGPQMPGCLVPRMGQNWLQSGRRQRGADKMFCIFITVLVIWMYKVTKTLQTAKLINVCILFYINNFLTKVLLKYFICGHVNTWIELWYLIQKYEFDSQLTVKIWHIFLLPSSSTIKAHLIQLWESLYNYTRFKLKLGCTHTHKQKKKLP